MFEAFGRYQLVKKLATGGMGQVYLAKQTGPVGFEKLVVVKRILPHLSEQEEFIQMFFDEARIAALLNHPNIAQIYDLGEVDGIYYIAMEFVHGESLRAVNAQANADKGGLPWPLKLRVIADAAGGLDFAHRARSPSGKPLNLIHRDVSPQNILVGFNGAVKLIDFGVAKAAGKISTTMTGAIKGKYAYMSPEQARGEELDSRSDVFGLGIVFYELLTSSRLFKRESETATLRAVVGTKVAPPSSVVKGLHKTVDAIVLKALAKKRQERFQSAQELQLAIEELLMKQRQPATSAHLAAFMRELYPTESAADPLGETAQEKAPAKGGPSASRPAAEPPRAITSPKRRPAEEGEGRARSGTGSAARAADKSVERSAPRAPEPKASTSSNVSAARNGELRKAANAQLIPDIGELDARLAATGPNDTVRGLFFNAVLGAVTRFAGPIAEAPVRAAGDERQYTDGFSYPTGDFLRVLWKAAEVIAPMCTGVDRAFMELGGACLESLAAVSGSSLDSSEDEPRFLLKPLMVALQALLPVGERAVESAHPGQAVLVYRRDSLPPQFHGGLVRRALERLRGAKVTRVEWGQRGPDAFTLELDW